MAICHFRKQQMKSLFVRVLVRFNSPIQSSLTLIIGDPYLHHSQGLRPILTRKFPSQTLISTEETKTPMVHPRRCGQIAVRRNPLVEAVHGNHSWDRSVTALASSRNP
ncbi:hypothetical protein CXB51_034563 [Gossypium anomalum]|uniref:Uncharacterized protein n=1 Tax=Gossypium anomalum TaxID=47600 RepID=A0A8J6CM06_9ROSI|nr:hypothetical protein CXB51_034563 [Gossypium anomalum]